MRAHVSNIVTQVLFLIFLNWSWKIGKFAQIDSMRLESNNCIWVGVNTRAQVAGEYQQLDSQISHLVASPVY